MDDQDKGLRWASLALSWQAGGAGLCREAPEQLEHLVGLCKSTRLPGGASVLRNLNLLSILKSK